jgi:hypothetical protein
VRLIALAAGHQLIFSHSGVIAREILQFLREPAITQPDKQLVERV